MSLFASLSRVESNTSLISLRSLATCLQAIDPSCTYRTVRARLKSPVYTKALTVCGNDCGFSTDMLATLVTVCLAKLDENAKRDALAEALNLSRPNNEVTDKADAKVVTAIANNNAAIMRAKATLDNATKTVEPLCLEDGTEDATDDDRVINDATNPMTVAIKTAAAYGEDITKAVEFKAYTFKSSLKMAANIDTVGGAYFDCELGGIDSLLTLAIGRKVTHNDYSDSCRYRSSISGCSTPIVPATELLGALNKVCTNLSEEAQARVLPIYKDAITVAWQCVHTDDIDRLTFGQAQSLAAQIQGRFDDMNPGQRTQYNRAAGEFLAKLLKGAKVIPSDSVECICELNAAQARINDRRAKEAAASSQSEAVTEHTAQTTPIAAAATEAATKVALKTTAEAPVLCVDVESDDDSTNTPSEAMGFVYEPAKGICEFDHLDVYGNPVIPQDGFNQGLDVPSTDIHTA